MTQVRPAAHPDVRAPDRFLRDVERRALQMADLALTPYAAALDAVGDAMCGFAAKHEAHAEADWPVLFWGLLDRGLDDRRGAARADPASPGPFMHLSDARAMRALDSVLRALPAHQRQAFLLRVREGLDAAAIARITRLSESVVRAQLFHALRNLRSGLRTAPASPAGNDVREDGAWILRCRALLDGAARNLDDATLARLTRARQEAPVPAATQAPSASRWLVRAGGLGIVVGAALALSRLLPSLDVLSPPTPLPPIETPPPPAPPPPSIAPSEDTPLAAPDFDLLLDDDDETLLEDLEFYAWLASEDPR